MLALEVATLAVYTLLACVDCEFFSPVGKIHRPIFAKFDRSSASDKFREGQFKFYHLGFLASKLRIGSNNVCGVQSIASHTL